MATSQANKEEIPKLLRRLPLDRSRGAAAVEFVLILPILVLLVFGIYEFGRAYNAKVTLTHATREAVRDYTINQVEANAIVIGEDAEPNLVGVVVTLEDDCDAAIPNDVATMKATWDQDYVIPLFKSGTWNISETATMRCGG